MTWIWAIVAKLHFFGLASLFCTEKCKWRLRKIIYFIFCLFFVILFIYFCFVLFSYFSPFRFYREFEYRFIIDRHLIGSEDMSRASMLCAVRVESDVDRSLWKLVWKYTSFLTLTRFITFYNTKETLEKGTQKALYMVDAKYFMAAERNGYNGQIFEALRNRFPEIPEQVISQTLQAEVSRFLISHW